MLTIPTNDLLGTVGDVIALAGPDDLPELHRVQLRWDGEMFTASATDTIRVGVSAWHPDDRPDSDVQDDLETKLGSDDPDERWMFVADATDMALLLKNLKPRKGHEYVPLRLTVRDGVLSVRRDKAAGLVGASLDFDVQDGDVVDLPTALDRATEVSEKVESLSFNAAYLADFAKARQRGGAMRLTFGGSRRATLVEIGERFRGAIQPVRSAEDRAEAA